MKTVNHFHDCSSFGKKTHHLVPQCKCGLVNVIINIFLRLLCYQEAQNAAPVSTLVEVVNTLRCFGNRCFRRGHFDSAKDYYKQVGTFLVCLVFFFIGFVITCGKM